MLDKALGNHQPSPPGAARVGIGGPVGSGKTALIEALIPVLQRRQIDFAVVTNDLVTREDAERLRRSGLIDPARVSAVEAGACPHTVIREDPTLNIAAGDDLEARFPGLELSTEWPDEALERLKPDHRSAVVTLTHDPKLDDPALAVALRSECFYIGALGSKRTHAARCSRLKEMGFTDTDLARIHGPIGLSIGAVSPAEIAVSILGQMTQILRRGEKSEAA